MPIGVVLGIFLSTVLLLGWLLGGKVGIGTLVAAVGSGIAMQIVYKIIRFEPRDIEHRSVTDTMKILKKAE